jgi:hypothetical protein
MNENLYKAMGFHVQARGAASLRFRLDHISLSRPLPARQRGCAGLKLAFNKSRVAGSKPCAFIRVRGVTPTFISSSTARATPFVSRHPDKRFRRRKIILCGHPPGTTKLGGREGLYDLVFVSL